MVSAASSPILAAVSYMRIRSMRFLRDLASPVPHAVSNALVCSSPRWSTGLRAGGLTRMPAASSPSAVNAGCSRPAWSRNTRIVVILSMMVRSEYPRSVRIHSTPPAQARPVEMPETDVAALRAFRGFEPSDVGFQADAVRLDGLRRSSPRTLGSQWCSRSLSARLARSPVHRSWRPFSLPCSWSPPFPGPRVRRRRRGPRIRP